MKIIQIEVVQLKGIDEKSRNATIYGLGDDGVVYKKLVGENWTKVEGLF